MNSSSDHCPLCKSNEVRLLSTVKDIEYFTSDINYEYFGCDSCSSIYLKNPPVTSLAKIYPDDYYSIKGPDHHRRSLNKFLEGIKNHLDKLLFRKALKKVRSSSISSLDIGGGAGWISNIVREADSRVKRTFIMDINESSRPIAESNGHTYIHGMADSLESHNEFDFVLMLNLIEHVENPGKTLDCIHAAMKPDGILLVKTPNTLSLNRRLFEGLYWGGYHAPRHWILFNKQSFSRLAVDCGFHIENFRYTQGTPQWVASILGSAELRFPGRKRRPMYANPYAPMLSLMFAAFDFLRLPLFATDQMIFILRKKDGMLHYRRSP
jgi:2-polyprenyl-3-methyl-5-hydroxy-6-metoxy-1,4-benzoquinol methylase